MLIISFILTIHILLFIGICSVAYFPNVKWRTIELHATIIIYHTNYLVELIHIWQIVRNENIYSILSSISGSVQKNQNLQIVPSRNLSLEKEMRRG